MNFHQDNSKKKSKSNFRFFSPIIILVVIFYFVSGPILTTGFSIISLFATPLWGIEERVKTGFQTFFSYLSSKDRLTIENYKLKDELDSKRVLLDSYNALEEENNSLILEMGRQQLLPDSLVATVLSGPNIPPYESLILDVGTNDGVKQGDRVFYSNVAIGEINQVLQTSSKVRLYSASGVRTGVILQSKGGYIHTVAIGFGGGNFYIELPTNIGINQGASVLVPNSRLVILGKVDLISVDETMSIQRILVRYPFNTKMVRFVEVVRNSANEKLE